ncbi:MAG: hypothetical protein LBQ66_16790 [Planctomycetaceae bacterium]|jgi:hypothetical protein|nr:hypothetical protein [Planctomycetaceae bacterium]
MFTFQLVEVLVILFAAVILIGGLALFVIRRRNEILQDFFTPEEPELADEFFKKRPAAVADEDKEVTDNNAQSDEESIGGWGIPNNDNT